MAPVTSVLQYASWPSLLFVVLVLWAFGMVDIDRHRRRGTFTGAGLLCMVGCISLVAIVAVAGVGAIFADPWAETVATADLDRRETGELREPARSPVFSFGLENASYAAVGPAGEDGAGAPR
jgi:uncharacterized membrane protein YwzB